MTAEAWEGYEKLLKKSISSSVFEPYWRLRKEMHNQRFQNLIEQLLKDPDKRKLFQYEGEF